MAKEIRTLKFPGDLEPREIVDAKAREQLSKLSEEKVVKYSAQNLTEEEKAQARANIGAVALNSTGKVMYDYSQYIKTNWVEYASSGTGGEVTGGDSACIPCVSGETYIINLSNIARGGTPCYIRDGGKTNILDIVGGNDAITTEDIEFVIPENGAWIVLNYGSYGAKPALYKYESGSGGNDCEVMQDFGFSETATISQKAITNAFVETFENDTLSFKYFTEGQLCSGMVTGVGAAGTNRVCTKSPIIFSSEKIVHIEDGRRASFHLLNDDLTLKTDSGWQTEKYTVPAKTPFGVLISNASSTTTEEVSQKLTDADITTFLSYLTVENVVTPENTGEPWQDIVELRNGSLGNSSNGDAVAFKYILPIKEKKFRIKYDVKLNGGSIRWNVCLWDYYGQLSDGNFDNKVAPYYVDHDTTTNYIDVDFTNYSNATGYSVSIFVMDVSGANIPQRVGSNASTMYVGYGSSTSNNYPSYWGDSVATVIEEVNDIQHSGGRDITTFAFLTDTHASVSHNGSFAKILAEVMDKCEIPVYIHGGDFISGAGIISKEGILEEISHNKEIFKDIEHKGLLTLGNHDMAFGVSDYYDSNLSDAEIYSHIFRINEGKSGIVFGDKGTYFYKDVPSQNMRYIVLDSYGFETTLDTNQVVVSNNKMRNRKMGNTQLNWLANTALNVPDGYHIVICSHNAPYTKTQMDNYGWTEDTVMLDCEVAQGIVNAYRNKTTYNYSGTIGSDTMAEAYDVSVNFENAKGTVVCWLAGHTHKDGIIDCDGLQVVVSANCSMDVADRDAPAKTSGTDTEYVIDFLCVNKANRNCKIVRLGAELSENANGRTFNY